MSDDFSFPVFLTDSQSLLLTDSLSLTDLSVVCVVCPNGSVKFSLLALAFSSRRTSCPLELTSSRGTRRPELSNSKGPCLCTGSGTLPSRGSSCVVGGDFAPRRPTGGGPCWPLPPCVLCSRPLIASVPSKSSETASCRPSTDASSVLSSASSPWDRFGCSV